MSKWDNDGDWFFDHFDKSAKRAGWLVAGVFVLNLLFWLAIIAAACFGLWLVFG